MNHQNEMTFYENDSLFKIVFIIFTILKNSFAK